MLTIRADLHSFALLGIYLVLLNLLVIVLFLVTPPTVLVLYFLIRQGDCIQHLFFWCLGERGCLWSGCAHKLKLSSKVNI